MAFVKRPESLTGRIHMSVPEEQRLPSKAGPFMPCPAPKLPAADFHEIEARVAAWYAEQGL